MVIISSTRLATLVSVLMVAKSEARAGLATRVIAAGEGKFGNLDEMKIARAFQKGSLMNSAVLMLNDGDDFVISDVMARLMQTIKEKTEIIHELVKDLVERVELINGQNEMVVKYNTNSNG